MPRMTVRFAILAAALAALTLALPAIAPAAAQNATPTAGAAVITLPDRIVDLSPDGASILTRSQDKICVYDVATRKQRACGDLAAKKIRIRPDDIVWSPDGTKIALAENGFQTFIDGDLWVMDAATGQLTDITDDHYAGPLVAFGANADAAKTLHFMDVLPAWSPDSKSIAFSRSPVVAGEPAGNDLAIVSASGGPVKIVATVDPRQMGILYYGLAWTPDAKSLVYSHMGVSKDDPDNGVWMVAVSGGAPRRVIGADAKLGRPVILSVNAAGTTGLLFYIEAAQSFTAREDVYWLLDLKTGERAVVALPAGAPKGAFIGGATFSPDGAKLLFILKNGQSGDKLVIRDLASGTESTILAGQSLSITGVNQGLDWTNSGAIFVATSNLRSGLLLHVATAPPAIPPSEPATPVADGGSTSGQAFAAGDVVIANDAANLRVRPSTDAAVAEPVTKGTKLVILGPPVGDEGFVWWPVSDPSTDALGWIRAEFIAKS